MSYQVLARKWRPQNFEQLVGQEHVLGALVNALENERLHHAYLFSGTRGVGKTTIARILARSLNCETGITAKPCGECASCQEISEGRFVDLIEVDAASRTKVEDTRDLLENVQYRPTRGRFKIYLIDEVHMLSNHSFNALLKTLEEPPEHVKFLLATTDPQKLPVTVLSRCLQFNLKNLPAQRITEYLEHVLGEEKVPFEKNALGHLARAASGSMRDALSLTDQAISHGGGKLAEQDVVDMLGTVDRKRIYQVIHAIAANDGQALMQQCQDLAQYSVDYLALLEEMLALFHAIAVAQVVPESESGFGDQEQVSELAHKLSREDVQLHYQMLLMGRKDLVAAPDMHLGFEMLMLRLLAFQPESKTAAVVQNVETRDTQANDVQASAPSGVNTAKKSEAAAEQKPQAASGITSAKALPISETTPPILEEAPPVSEEAPPINDAAKIEPLEVPLQTPAQIRAQETRPVSELSESDVELHQSLREFSSLEKEIPGAAIETKRVSETVAELMLEDLPEEVPASPENTLVNHVDAEPLEVGCESQQPNELAETDPPKNLQALNSETWIALFRILPLSGAVKSVVSHMVLEQNTNGQVQFKLAEAGQPLFNANHQQRLADVLTRHFGSPVDIDVALGNVERETPAENARRLHHEALVAAEQRMLNDPLVGEFMNEFQAQLVPDSVIFCDNES